MFFSFFFLFVAFFSSLHLFFPISCFCTLLLTLRVSLLWVCTTLLRLLVCMCVFGVLVCVHQYKAHLNIKGLQREEGPDAAPW